MNHHEGLHKKRTFHNNLNYFPKLSSCVLSQPQSNARCDGSNDLCDFQQNIVIVTNDFPSPRDIINRGNLSCYIKLCQNITKSFL